jgi:hypothetical protein
MQRMNRPAGRWVRWLARFPGIAAKAQALAEAGEDRIREHGIRRILPHLAVDGGYAVQDGPFRGLLYPAVFAAGSLWAPKLLGAYESELHPLLERLCARPYDWIVVVGAGEGYYAVGLLRCLHLATCLAFETDPAGQDFCRRLAAANGVGERLTVRGHCDAEGLAEALAGRRGLIVCDCEGMELELLRPARLPDLQTYDILVELHERRRTGPTVMEVIQQRFEATHSATLINVRPVKSLKYKLLSDFERSAALVLLDERRRVSVGWAYLESATGVGRQPGRQGPEAAPEE